jgi:hypothetical protein
VVSDQKENRKEKRWQNNDAGKHSDQAVIHVMGKSVQMHV